MGSGSGKHLDQRLRELAADVAPADEETRIAARAVLTEEIEVDKSGTRPRSRRRPGRRLLVAILALVVGSGGLAVAYEVEWIFRSDTDPPVYSLDPLDPEAAEQIQGAIEGGEKYPATDGDVSYCRKQQAQQRVDASCALTLEALEAGELDPVPGPISTVHLIPCGQEPGRGEVPSCGGPITEREIEEALSR